MKISKIHLISENANKDFGLCVVNFTLEYCPIGLQIIDRSKDIKHDDQDSPTAH